MLNIFPPDPCCQRRFQKAALPDEADSWECPKCGCEWKSATFESGKVWGPVTVIQIW